MIVPQILAWLTGPNGNERQGHEEKWQGRVLESSDNYREFELDRFDDDDDGDAQDEGTGDDPIDDIFRKLDDAIDSDVHGIRRLNVEQPRTPQQPKQDDGKQGWRARFRKVVFPDDHDISTFTPTYRYTPILSGVVIPFSILLEIPGLTEDWYIRTDEHQIVETRPNPVILDVGLAFSLACAAIANLALIVRFLEKHVKAMTLTCILFLTVHDMINIIAVVIFGVEHRFDDGFTYGQSFWITICSTVASTFTNVTLIVDYVRTSDFAASGSGLTRKQRSLVIIIIVLLSYIALGSLINTALLNLTFIDSLYFSTVIIESIGYGDIVVSSTGARVFVSFYVVFGIVNLALAVSMMRGTIIESLEVGSQSRLRDMRRRRHARRLAARVSRRWTAAVSWRLDIRGEPKWVRDGDPNFDTFLSKLLRCLPKHAGDVPWFDFGSPELGRVRHPRGMHLNVEALPRSELEAAAFEAGVPLQSLVPPEYFSRRKRRNLTKKTQPTGRSLPTSPQTHQSRSGPLDIPTTPPPACSAGSPQAPYEPVPGHVPLTHVRLGMMSAILGRFALSVAWSNLIGVPDVGRPSIPQQDSTRAGGRIRAGLPKKRSLAEQYEAYKARVEKEEQRAFYVRLSVVWMLFLVFWMMGSTIFSHTEGWSFGNAMWFCVVSFTTLGLGDFSPKSPTGRAVFVVWALLGVATMTMLISVIGEAYSSRYQSVLHTTVLDRALKRYRTETMGDSDDGPGRDDEGTKASSDKNPTKKRNGEEGKVVPLEELPQEILHHTRTLREHVQYFVMHRGSSNPQSQNRVPDSVQRLLDEVSGAEQLEETIKREILQDEDAREVRTSQSCHFDTPQTDHHRGNASSIWAILART